MVNFISHSSYHFTTNQPLMSNLICLPIWATKGPAPAYTHWCQVKPFTLLEALIKSLSIIREIIYKRAMTHVLVEMALVIFFFWIHHCSTVNSGLHGNRHKTGTLLGLLTNHMLQRHIRMDITNKVFTSDHYHYVRQQ